ncbi:MAG TPA: isoprenylcysteine carboxylmethyltransferase family protein, partial [candidate division Zixibacteria bacterium]|nr:isoprenylcysteine carboxylmethyltransferase family protein [candidate division Zixibacteria bacterium]
MGRVLAFLFGVVSYVLFLVAFLYAIAWVNNVSLPEWVPYTIDNGRMSGSLIEALLINSGLLGLFAVQHSIMARIWFKKIWTRIVSPAIERSIFVLLTSLILFLMYWQWRTLGDPVWNLTGSTAGMALEVLGYIGWLIVLLSTFMINHFDLFGLRQVTLYLQKKPYTPVKFQTTGFYRFLRHPLMLGFMIAF